MTATIGQALRDAWASQQKGIALLYTPDVALMVRLQPDGQGAAVLHDHAGPLDEQRVESAYEIIAFSPDRQVRVWRSGGSVRTGEELSCTAEGCLTSEQLLWGRVSAVERGWATMSGSRAGEYLVPAPEGAAAKARLALLVHECTATDSHGNVGVTRSRFTGVAVSGGDR